MQSILILPSSHTAQTHNSLAFSFRNTLFLAKNKAHPFLFFDQIAHENKKSKMQPLHNFRFLPWNLMSKAASSDDQEDDLKPNEPQLDFPTGRRRKRTSPLARNVTKPEPVKPTYRRLRLKYQEEEKTNKRKEKEESVVVKKDYVAGFINLRPRTKVQSPTSIDPNASSSNNGFSLTLSKKEIEEDFLLMTGKMPPRNPKKRKMSVQKKINRLCLGIGLDEVCEEAYEVTTKKSSR